MKWNWGTKLVIAMAIFMSFIFYLVYQSTQNEINLVEKDYYPKGLKYQDRIEETKNAAPYASQIQVYQQIEDIVIQFPEINPDTGSVVFFRPSDTDSDKIFSLKPDTSSSIAIPKSSLVKGKYIIKFFWKEDGKGFYLEKPFYVN